MRHAVIGDVGGHVTALRHELVRLGVDVDAGTIPEDLTIVQVGDLVHRGPDSEAVVALVDRLLRRGHGRWVQLVGNHEAQYLRYPAFTWHDWIDEDAAGALRRWWAAGKMRVAAVVPSPAGEVLVTHAGITEEFWRRDLGRPQSAAAAAERLNRMPADGNDAIFRGGVMLSGRLAMRAGPLWAEPARELLASWKGHRMPFNQVHGHASCFAWQARRWRQIVPQWTVDGMEIDVLRSHETFEVGGGFVVGIDPDHGTRAQEAWAAWTPVEAYGYESLAAEA